MTCPSRLHYLLGSEHELTLSYPSQTYLDYITPAELFNIVIKHANIHMGGLSNKVVWDMFAGIGTDSIRLARVSGKVIATELNKDTYQCLINNINAASNPSTLNPSTLNPSTLNPLNIDTRNTDATHMCTALNPDVIYFDPPWGDTFKSGQPFTFAEVTLSNGKVVMDVYDDLRKNYKEAYLLVKAPYTCEMDIPDSELLCILSFNRQKLKYYLIGPVGERSA